MVEKFRLTSAKTVNTPMEPGAQFSVDQSPSSLSQMAKMHGIPYSEAISSVLWPVVVSRPDVAYAVGVLSQFIQNPGPAHWEGVKRVISYLGIMKNLWLTFGGQTEGHIRGSVMWTGQVRNTTIPSLGTCSIMVSERCPGVPRSRTSCHCQARRLST